MALPDVHEIMLARNVLLRIVAAAWDRGTSYDMLLARITPEEAKSAVLWRGHGKEPKE